MIRLDVKLLGRMTCKLPDGQPLRLSTRKSEALLAYLAMSPGVYHPRERLVNLFWSDRGEDQARNSLRQALSSLKKPLDKAIPELLEVERTTVRLKPELITVDVDAFGFLAAESEIKKLVEAVDIYSGEFLEGIAIRDPSGEQWLTEERENLKRIYSDVLGRLSQLQLEAADFRSAITSAERLVATDPLEESGWRRLMIANHRNGNRNHALMAYKRCCDVLQRELGVEPEPQTRELQEQIKLGQLADSGQASEVIKPKKSSSEADQGEAVENSILVLPLQNLSNDSDQQYFSDGLTESIITGLSRFPSLRVHSRNSSFAAREQNLSTQQIGDRFGVRYVVEGSLRRSEERIRINAQLVNVESGKQIWGEQFDNRLEDTFELEDRITRAIVSTVKGKIDATDEKIAIHKPAKDIASYDLILRGFHQVMKNNPKDNRAGIELLKQYLATEDNNDLAHLHIYHGYLINWISCWDEPRDEFLDKAGVHVRKALELNPDNAFSQACMAEYQMFRHEWQLAESHADKAIRLNPNDPESLATVCPVYAALGDIDRALEYADACLLHDPFHPWINWVAGDAYYAARKYKEALNAFQNISNPADEIRGWMAACYQRLGDHDNAVRYLKQYLDLTKKHMARFPQTLEEWKSIWESIAVYRYQENLDHPFDALCEAGLTDSIEKSEKPEIGETHSIAVLPFDNLSGDPEQEYFSDGITESVILNLSLFPGLNVKSRNSSFAFKQQIKSLGEISKELNVDYVVEGSIRKSSDRIRITVQLVEADSGNQIWGKRYDSEIENLFDLEEELSRTIAATVTGQIESDLQRIAIAKGAAGQQSYDLLLSGTYHAYQFNRQDTVLAIDKLNQCLTQDADNIRAHVLLYVCHAMDYLGRWTLDHRASFKLAEIHIQKALTLDPESSFVQTYYAEFLNFSGKLKEGAHYLDKALASNPNNPDALAIKAYGLIVQGEFEAALQTAEHALRLDPYHPWAEWELSGAQFFLGDYETALETIRQFRTSPGFTQVYIVVANVRVGRIDLARQAWRTFFQECQETMLSMPKTIDEWLDYLGESYVFTDAQINQDVINCLVQAGLENTSDQNITSDVGEQKPSLLVLPFGNLSGDQDQEYFSDGMTESIILSLSSFSGLNVKSRHASFAFKDSPLSIAEIARELEVQFIVDGSVRKRGEQVRVTVQLGDTKSGNQIWGKRFDTPLADLFELEEELVRTIAGTISGKIDREIKTSSARKPTKNLRSYDYLMRAWHYVEKYTPEDNFAALDMLDRCLEIDPDYVEAHTLIAATNSVQLFENWTDNRQQTKSSTKKHLLKALDLDPGDAFSHVILSAYLVLERDFKTALFHSEKSIELNPALPDGHSSKAYVLSCLGKIDQAVEMASFSLQIDPYHYYMGWDAGLVFHRAGLYEKAIKAFQSIPMMPPSLLAEMAACQFALGDGVKARATMKKYRQLAREQMPNFPTTVDAWRSLWYENEPFESDQDFDIYFNRLLEAGLCDEFIESSETLPSILVLPFENLSGDPEQEYVSNGMTESIILNLNSFQGLKVKSRHASFAFKDSSLSIDEIAQKLDVQFVVEGSVRKRGEQIRTTVQLAETANGNQIWGKRFDTPMEDLLDLEEELVQTIAGAISGRIDRELRATSALKTASSMKSYDYLMRGWYHAERFNPEDYELSIQYLRKCVELDPENGQAHAVLTGIVNVLLYENWTTDRGAVRREADYHINRALELDRNNALAHAFMSEHQILQHNHKKALFHAEKAIEHNPALPDGYSTKSYLLSTMGQHEEAVKLAEFSLQMDPYHFYMAWNAGIVYRNAGEYQKAIDAFRLLPYPSPGIYAELAASLVGNGDVEEAHEEMARFKNFAREQMPQYPNTVEAWRFFWRDVSGYQYDEDFESFFDLMLKAGLCDDIVQDPSELPSIAVLPFENLSGDPEQEYFSDGITANVILGLGLFKGLAVKSQRSSFALKESSLDSKAIAKKLEANYLVEGSIRKLGNRIRLSVQLIDASNSHQIWGKQYDEELAEVLELEQELSRTIAATVSGRIEHEIQQTSVRKSASNLASYDHLMRGLYHFGRFTANDLIIGCEEIRKCLEIDPDNAIGHYNLASALGLQVLENWAEDRQKNLDDAFEHHTIALKLDPDNAQSHAYFSETLVLLGDYEQAEYHSRRSIELNPTASEGHASLADVLCNTRRAEEALIHAEQCLKLDPYSAHAGWVAGDVFRNMGEFARAIKTFRSISHPAPTIHAMVATCFVGMGLLEEAQSEMKLYLELARSQMAVFPESVDAWRKFWRDNSFYQFDEDFDAFFGQLLEAGLCQSADNFSEETPSIAVLPFENMSGDPEQEYFADGITTDIIATLSRFRHMRTMSRFSILKYKTEKASIEEIATEQGVRYILEGSVRRSGKRIRVSAELIDSQSHDAVWSERYDRNLDDLFAVQDEIAQSIAIALKVHLDDGDMVMHRSAGTSNIKAWELVLTAVDLQDTYIQKNILEARSMAVEATRLDPDYPYAWVSLGWTYWQEIYAGWGSDSIDELLAEAEQACQKAFDLLSDYSEAWTLQGLIHLMKHQADQALEACRRAVDLEPGNAEVQALMAFTYLFVDDSQQARKHNQNMLKLCPVLPNWYYLIEGEIHRLEGNPSESIQIYRQGIDVEPESPLCRFYLVDALMQMGEIANAKKIADEIKALDDSANGKGLVQAFSSDAAIRESFRANLAQFHLV